MRQKRQFTAAEKRDGLALVGLLFCVAGAFLLSPVIGLFVLGIGLIALAFVSAIMA